ncbi:MAG: hypothetical protein IKW97_04995 [Muribaculaceae bacterium]|nr:hypothetical protein [Muribaculaceae bacterium]
MDHFNWPVIVKPVDITSSKDVTRIAKGQLDHFVLVLNRFISIITQ